MFSSSVCDPTHKVNAVFLYLFMSESKQLIISMVGETVYLLPDHGLLNSGTIVIKKSQCTTLPS